MNPSKCCVLDVDYWNLQLRQKNRLFSWLNKKNSLILWWQFLHPLDVSKSLETPMNKGFLSSSKNYEFEPISAITVPAFLAV